MQFLEGRETTTEIGGARERKNEARQGRRGKHKEEERQPAAAAVEKPPEATTG
ncbi:BnaA08g03690D [Brassica napus]|uniref:BnaA08g03690D protein n=1 Tax=Brassica napus TaxID=3708 RepID=A0A078FR91_BRANA|nr:BnaA08g03690D [Brassica napus]